MRYNTCILQTVLVSVLYCQKSDALCPGFCVESKRDCKESGGIVTQGSQFCFGLKGTCCIPSKINRKECGAEVSGLENNYYFASPKFPALSSGNLLCTFTMPVRNDTVAIAIDFLLLDSENNKPGSDVCDADKLFIRGFKGFSSDSYCGLYSGYQLVIDDRETKYMTNLTILAMMSSNEYRWLIKVHQASSRDCLEKKDFIVNGKQSLKRSSKKSRTKRSENHGFAVQTLGGHHQNGLLIDQDTQVNYVKPTPFVIEGSDSEQGDFPWQASLRIDYERLYPGRRFRSTVGGCDSSEGSHFCGGTIISETEVLTAAHCFDPAGNGRKRSPAYVYKVVVGDLNKCKDGKNGKRKKNQAVQEFHVEKITLHYNWDISTSFNDVAIVKIQGKIKFNDDVDKIEMAAKGSKFNGKFGVISGWGRISDVTGKSASVLQFNDEMLIQSTSSCKRRNSRGLETSGSRRRYKNQIDSYICISSKDPNSKASGGEGDSGGPFVVYQGKNETEPILVGITHQRTKYLADNVQISLSKPTTYLMSVAYYRNWIDIAMCV